RERFLPRARTAGRGGSLLRSSGKGATFEPGRSADDELARWYAERTMEHGGEGARAVVTHLECHLGDRLPPRQQRQRVHQPCLLAPDREAHAGLFLEAARESAASHADELRP